MTRAELIQYITDNVYPNARNEVTAPMVRDSLLEIVDFLGDAATYNIGMVASGNQGLVTGGNVNTAIALALLPYYTAVETGQAIDDAIARIGLGQAAYKNIGQVAENNTDLVTGGQVYTAINTALTSAIKFQGISDTPLTDGSTTNPIQINGQSYTAKKGDMVVYGGNEFLWVGNKWQQMGDESSYALKTVQITGTGYLTGGGDLTQSRTLDISATAKGYIDHGEAAYNYFPGGVLDSTHLPSMYIGTTSVQFTAAAQNLTGISSVRATSNILTLFEWDVTNSAWHFHGNIYTDGWFSGGGISSGGGGGGGGIDPVAMWRLLTNDPSLTQYDDYTKIAADHINFPVTSVVGLGGNVTAQQIAQALNLGSYAYKNTLSVSDIPDLSGTYLPLSGGTMTGVLNISYGTTSGNAAALRIAHPNFSSESFEWATASIAGSLPAQGHYIHLIGKYESLYNSAWFGYCHNGDGSNSNFASIGLYGVDDIIVANGHGRVGIMRSDPQYVLDVNGTLNATTIYQNGTALGSNAFNSTAFLPLVAGYANQLSGDLIFSSGNHAVHFYRTGGSMAGYLAWSENSYGNYVELFNPISNRGIWIGDMDTTAPIYYDGSNQRKIWHAGNLSLSTLVGNTSIGGSTQPLYYNGSALVAGTALNTMAYENAGDYLPLTAGSGKAITGSLYINATDASGCLRVTDYSTDTWVWTSGFYAPNLPVGNQTILLLGTSGSSGNAGWLGFHNAGNASSSNCVGIGFHSRDWLVNAFYSGNVTIGTENTTDYGYKLYVAGNIASPGVIYATTGIYTDGWFSGGGVASSSDRRLKKNIKNFAYTPKLLLAIRPREWDWKDGSAMVGHASGFVAQEIEPIMPYAVDGTRNFKALFYDRFHALEIAGLQDHERRIVELERAVKERDKKIAKLEKMLKLN